MFGYLDAGSVSVVLAAIAGGVAGIAVFFKMFWHRILGVVSPKHREKAKEARAQLVTKPEDEPTDEPSSSGPGSPEPSSTKST